MSISASVVPSASARNRNRSPIRFRAKTVEPAPMTAIFGATRPRRRRSAREGERVAGLLVEEVNLRRIEPDLGLVAGSRPALGTEPRHQHGLSAVGQLS